MATYIPGVTDYIPQIQPFRPDFNFYAGALQMKQTQYDTAHKQISNLYGSLLNAPMLRDNNIQARDQYFKVIEQEIKKISNLDLSEQQNVDAATNLFSGLYDNDNIVKDMVWTKNYQKELQRADGFRNCVDPAKCGGSYWDGGVKALNYKADEFRNATDEQALGFGNVRFTPYQNVMEKAIKLAKDADLNITVDQVQGRYIVTTKNGPNLIDPLNSLFTGVLANDPGVMDYYKTKAYVDRKDWVQSNVPMYGSLEAAEMAYVQNVTEGLGSALGLAKSEVDAYVGNLEGQRKQLENRIRTEGVNPTGTLAEQYRALNQVEQQGMASQQSINDANSIYQKTLDPALQAFIGDNIDGAMASYLLAGDIGMAAQTLAYKDYEYKLKEDPYAMEGVRQANRLMLENVRFEHDMLLKKFDYDMKAYTEKKSAMGGDVDNIPLTKKIVTGGTDVNLSETGAFDMFKKIQKEDIKDLSGGERKLLTEFMSLTQQKSKSENGKGMATDDLVKFGDILFSELANSGGQLYNETKGEYISNAQLAKDNKALYDKWNNMSYDQKVKFAQGQDFNKVVQHSGISGTVLDGLYNDLVLPASDYTNPSNRVNKNYLESFWTADENIVLRNNIQQKNLVLQGMGEWYTRESQNVIQNMKAGEYAQYAPLMQMYINPETGGKRTAVEFANSYAEAAVQTEGMEFNEAYQQALGIYNGGLGTLLPGSSTSGNIATWALGGIPALLMTGGDSDSEGATLDQIWAQAFSKYAKADGQELTLGLMGSDSYASMGLQFPAVDPAKYMSGATTNTISFLKDALAADSESVKFALGAPSAGLPEETDPLMQNFMSQLFSDMVNKKNPADASRPILDVTFQRIAGADDEWSALHIKMNHPYMKNFVGSKASPGPFFGMNEQLANGFTVYLNDNSATNGFYNATKTSDLEQMLHYTGQYKFDAYPEYSKDVKLEMNNAGNYVLTGMVMAGYDSNGNQTWQPLHVPYDKLGTDPNQMVSDINSFLQTNALQNREVEMYLNSQNGVKDPAALLTQ